MKWKFKDLRTRLYLIAVVILLVGSGSSIFVYLTAEDVSDGDMVYQFQNSKLYRHDLELTGGKVNVLADEFFRWFQNLWHGKALAFTVACIASSISLALFFVAYHMPRGLNPFARDENNQNDR